MKISILKNNTFSLSQDFSENEDFLKNEEIDFDSETQSVQVENGIVTISKKKVPESPTEKHARVTQKVLTGSFTKEDLEGETFTSDEKRKIINTLVYGDELTETYWLKKEIRLSSKSSTLYTKPGTMFSASEKADCLKIQEQIKRIDELKTLLS